MSRLVGGGFTTRHVNIVNAGASDKSSTFKLLIESSFGMAHVVDTCPALKRAAKCVDIDIVVLDQVLTEPAANVSVV